MRFVYNITMFKRPSRSTEAFRLKLGALGTGGEARGAALGGGAGAGAGMSAVAAYAGGAGGRRARLQLAAARAPPHAHHALPLMAYHLAHQLYPFIKSIL